ILDLLFNLATWQAYAKLQLHTEETLKSFDAATVILDKTVCKFKQITCEVYITTELPHEHVAQGYLQAALAANQQGTLAKNRGSPSYGKKLNIQTYKFHVLGHYPNTIQMRGTTDSYSMQPV
ncbi:hypothetical protein BDR04DRAFT_976047, partial [Suillus decipiens]